MKAKAGRTLPDLLEWIPQVSPKLMSPVHLADAGKLLQHYRERPFEFVFSVPPRHGKTVMVTHFIVWALIQDPTLCIAYVSYSARQAQDMGAKALKIAHAAGLRLSRETRGAWETPEGGLVHWEGVNGALTGRGYNVGIIDDPVKNRVEAESPVHRERAWGFMRSDLYTRLEAGGRGRHDPSVAVIQTRWHADDLAGRLTQGDVEEEIDPWHTINIPAILDEGTESERALCEPLISLARLKKTRRRVGPYAWSSLYQGHPMPRGMSVFGDPTFFVAEPKRYRPGMGLDLAYTSKTSSDHSVVVTMLHEAQTGAYYVVRVRRRQKTAPEFKDEIRQALSEFPGAPIRIYASGTEKGATDFLRVQDVDARGQRRPGLAVQVLAPKGDKFTRAVPFAAAWNDGRVAIPAPELVSAQPGKYGWVNDYLDELKVFTGTSDASDDQVDASAAAFDVLAVQGGYTGIRDAGVEVPRGRTI